MENLKDNVFCLAYSISATHSSIGVKADFENLGSLVNY